MHKTNITNPAYHIWRKKGRGVKTDLWYCTAEMHSKPIRKEPAQKVTVNNPWLGRYHEESKGAHKRMSKKTPAAMRARP